MIKAINGINIRKYDFTKEALMKCLPKGFKFKTKPYYHQLLSVVFALQFDAVGLFLEMGLGKTKIIIDIHRALKIRNKILVVALKSSIYQFASEFDKHAKGEYKIQILDVDIGSENFKAIIDKNEADVYITYYEALTYKNNVKDDVREFIVKAFDRPWNSVIFDESRKLKNFYSKRTKASIKIALESKHRYIMSGLPIAKKITEIFSQQAIIDFGKTFGGDYKDFEDQCYNKTWNGYFVEEEIIKGAEEEVYKLMYNQSIRFLKDEADDMPKKSYSNRYVLLSKEQRDFYDSLALLYKKTIISKKNAFQIKGILTKFHQITGGWMLMGDEKRKEIMSFEDNIKRDVLYDIITEELVSEKIVIFATYKAEQKYIYEFLKKKKIKCAKIVSGMKSKEIEYIKNDFNNTDKYQVLVCSYQVAGRALDFIGARYTIYYSLNADYEIVRQSEDRTARTGQKYKRCFYIRLIAKDTVDERYLEILENNEEMVDKVLEGKKLIDLL